MLWDSFLTSWTGGAQNNVKEFSYNLNPQLDG